MVVKAFSKTAIKVKTQARARAVSQAKHDEVNEAKAVRDHISPFRLSKRAAKQRVARIQEQLKRLETLEVVLTVVGTMKAGKSSCINAIVGREILPSRNRPMTSIPTLVRHTPGVNVPVLLFANTEPVQATIKKLGTALRRASGVRLAAVASDDALTKLAAKIGKGWVLKERYRGEAEIAFFLQSLNDLVRLAGIFNLEFPFEQFVAVQDFPLIEVEFLHLSQYDDIGSRGSIALLDTPGFNEAGHSTQMRKMLKEQLQRANAVLAVLDYTQLKSEAEAELIQELKAIAQHSQGRMFALINKFDRNDANSDDAQATVQYVSHHLLNSIVPEENIFAVSAQQAFLAQRAQLSLKQTQGLKWVARRTKDWRDDFGALAFGPRYARSMNDNAAVVEASKELWVASRFEAPLNHIIHFSQLSAVKFALGSSLGLIEALGQWLEDDS